MENKIDSDLTEEESLTDEEESLKNIYIIPTSHVSEDSSKLVHDVVESVNPDLIAVELDDKRFKKLLSEDKLSNTSMKDIITKSDMGLRGSLILAIFSKFQSKIAHKLGIDVIGLDMMAGYEESSKRDIPLALVDQDMQKTFKRFTKEITFMESMKTMISFILGYIHISRKSKDKLESEVSSDNIDVEEILMQIESVFPTFKKVFLDERNHVITEKTANLAKNFDNTVLVIGAAHEPGIKKLFNKNYPEINIKELPNSEE